MKIQIIVFACLLSVVITESSNWDILHPKDVIASSVDSRIVNGIISNLGTFPYMAPLFIKKSNGDSFCGGSLISDEFVLTAAHCLSEATEVKVYLGARSISAETDPNRIEFTIGSEGIFVHENYDGPGYLHDIALLKLPEKIQFTDEIQAIRLARRSLVKLENEMAILTGWGRTGNKADQSDVLRYAKLVVLPDEFCKKIYQNYFHPTNLCISGKGQSPCSGDSGGAAVIVEKHDRQFTQIGVASYVHSSGCENGLPVSYTRVSSYLDWIHKHTGIPIKD